MKKIMLSFAVLAIGAAAYFGFNSVPSSSNSSLLSQNIEALAAGEGGKTCTFRYVEKDEKNNFLKCKGSGSQCCVLD